MAKYLLACSCGKGVAVDQGQAGGSVTCDCGIRLEVPPLRQLRHLPRAPTESLEQPAPWSMKKAVVTAMLIGAVISGGIGVYYWWTVPQVTEFDAEIRLQEVESELQDMTPLEAWMIWRDYYSHFDKQGFVEYRDPHETQIKSSQRLHRLYYATALGVAGVFLLIALAVPLAGGRGSNRSSAGSPSTQ